MTRAWEIFRFELGYQVTRVSTRIYFGIFIALSMAAALSFLLDARNDGYFFNAPIITAAVTIVGSMIALLVIAGVAGDAATRDVEVRMHSLLYTTPLRKSAYLGGRFLGAFAVTALLLVAVPAGLLLTTQMPGIEARLLGPFRAEAYLMSYFYFAIPNAFVATAVLFSMAMVSRRAIAAYGGAAVLFFGTFVSDGYIADTLGKWDLARIVDPLGYTTMHGYWRSLNPLQKNTALISLDQALLTNRLLWLGVGAALLAIAYLRARMDFAIEGSRSERRAPAAADTTAPPRRVASAVTVPRAHSKSRKLLAITLHSLRELVTSRGWLIAPITAILFILTAPELLEVELGTPGAATTARVADILDGSELARFIALLIALSAGQLVWRERDARMNAIADVTPVPEWLTLLGKYLALALMLAATHVMFIGAGTIVQSLLGYFHFQPGLYVQLLLGVQLADYLLFAALAMVIHVLVNQKYVGNVIAIVAYLALQLAGELGLEHNLVRYGSAPRWSYSQMGGFGPEIVAWLWFKLYWFGWALLFAFVTYLFWMRGEERGLRWRLSLARRRITRGSAMFGALAIAIIAGAGGYVFYNTNVLHPYYTDAEIEGRRAEYERRYGRYASLPQPQLAATKLHVEFYPARAAATIRGTYRLENRSGVAIDAIHIAPHTGVETKNITFDRPSRATHVDDDLAYRIYQLDRAMQPGESVLMNLEIVAERRGFTNEGSDATVVANGSWIENRGDQAQRARQWLPAIGYQSSRELGIAGARAEHGLPARPAVRALEDTSARGAWNGGEKIDFEVTIGTDADQMGVAPGALRRTWVDNGRRYAHYVSDGKITNGYTIHSARYAVHRAKWRDVEIEIFHHPEHTANLERMVRSVQASLEYHTREYTPYPHRQLRMVEYPSSGRGLRLTAHPGLIKYSEGYALVRVEDDKQKIDLPFAVMAHEIGHQWWGHQLVPARVEGAALLSESLAWYSAMLVVEESVGRDHLQRILNMMRSQYLTPHETRDVSLLRAHDRLDAYRTGPFAMYALREAAGPERVNGALRTLLAKFPPDRAPYPTSLDLYAELRAATPATMHPLLKDLFEEITFWDLRAKKLDVHGSIATLHVEASKLKGDGTGKEKPVPMNDAIEIAFFDASGKVLHRATHRIRSGAQTIRVTLPREAARAVIDPDRELLDREPGDNEAGRE
jgi:ABC-2 type transport system permease protein